MCTYSSSSRVPSEVFHLCCMYWTKTKYLGARVFSKSAHSQTEENQTSRGSNSRSSQTLPQLLNILPEELLNPIH